MTANGIAAASKKSKTLTAANPRPCQRRGSQPARPKATRMAMAPIAGKASRPCDA